MNRLTTRLTLVGLGREVRSPLNSDPLYHVNIVSRLGLECSSKRTPAIHQPTNDMGELYRGQRWSWQRDWRQPAPNTPRTLGLTIKRFLIGMAMEFKVLIHHFELSVNQPGMDSHA